MSRTADDAIEIWTLASKGVMPGEYLLGMGVAALQASGVSLEEIQRVVADVFHTSWEECSALAKALEGGGKRGGN